MKGCASQACKVFLASSWFHFWTIKAGSVLTARTSVSVTVPLFACCSPLSWLRGEKKKKEGKDVMDYHTAVHHFGSSGDFMPLVNSTSTVALGHWALQPTFFRWAVAWMLRSMGECHLDALVSSLVPRTPGTGLFDLNRSDDVAVSHVSIVTWSSGQMV